MRDIPCETRRFLHGGRGGRQTSSHRRRWLPADRQCRPRPGKHGAAQRGAAQRQRDVLALLGKRAGDALRSVIDARSYQLAHRGNVLGQPDMHAVDRIAHLFGLTDERGIEQFVIDRSRHFDRSECAQMLGDELRVEQAVVAGS